MKRRMITYRHACLFSIVNPVYVSMKIKRITIEKSAVVIRNQLDYLQNLKSIQ